MRTKAEIEKLERDIEEEYYILDGECMDYVAAQYDGVLGACTRLVAMVEYNLEEEPLPERLNVQAMPKDWDKIHQACFEEAFRETWAWGMGRLDVNIFGEYVKAEK